MDLNRAMADHQISQKMKEKAEEGMRILLVCPGSTELPDDGFLSYTEGADIKALISAPDGGVLVFNEHQSKLLRLLTEYQDEFVCRIKVLEGVPNIEYSPWFNSITWSQDKVSYAGLLSEMSIAEAAAREEEATESVYKKEASQYTRSNGTVKAQDNFRLAGSEEDEEGETF